MKAWALESRAMSSLEAFQMRTFVRMLKGSWNTKKLNTIQCAHKITKMLITSRKPAVIMDQVIEYSVVRTTENLKSDLNNNIIPTK